MHLVVLILALFAQSANNDSKAFLARCVVKAVFSSNFAAKTLPRASFFFNLIMVRMRTNKNPHPPSQYQLSSLKSYGVFFLLEEGLGTGQKSNLTAKTDFFLVSVKSLSQFGQFLRLWKKPSQL